MTLQLVNPDSVLERMRKSIKGATWVVCPSCAGEWTKLRPCGYYWIDDRGRHDATSSVCADCAESVRGLMFCSRSWPINVPLDNLKVDVFWPQDNQPNWCDVDAIDPKTGKHYREKVMHWGRLQGRVRRWNFGNTGETVFDAFVKIGKSACQISVEVKGAEGPIYFENLISAWHWVKTKIEKGMEDKPTDESEEDFRRVR